jgi:hypothetical protein
VRHRRCVARAAQRVRDGPQVDVERGARRPAARRLSRVRRPAARGRSRENHGLLRDVQRACRAADCRLGRKAGAARRDSHPRGCLRCALGRDWRRLPPGRRRQRDRHIDLHHRPWGDGADHSRCVWGRPRVRAPRLRRHRSGTVGDRRHFRRPSLSSPRASNAIARARRACCV